MATTALTDCPKCAGTGTVSRFLDYKGGVCFDCGGTGTIPSPVLRPVAPVTVDPLVAARLVARRVLNGRGGAVSTDTAWDALMVIDAGGYADRADFAYIAALRPVAYSGPVA